MMRPIVPYLRILTWQRIWNWIRCYYACRRGKTKWNGYPTFVSVEPANFCQLRCPECPVGMRQYHKTAQTILPALFARLLAENADYMHTIIFYFQGEPLLHKDLPSLIRMAKEKRLFTYLSTNLQSITPDLAYALIASGIDHIVCSIDGISEESYQAYRQGGSLKKALNGLRLLHEEKQKQKVNTIIEWQCLYLKANEREWEEMRAKYRELGADILTFKTAQFYDYKYGNPLMPSHEKYSRYHHVNGEYIPKQGNTKSCQRMYMGCVMDVQGNIVPCCFDKGSEHILGNIKDNSLKSIWQGKRAQAFRQQVNSNRNAITICQNCIS